MFYNHLKSKTIVVMLGITLVVFVTCRKKDQGSEGDLNSPAVFQLCNVLISAQTKFIEMADSSQGDAKLALELTKDWVLKDPNVSRALVFDSAYLRIAMKSGMLTTLRINYLDDSGKSIFRGGSGSIASSLKAFSRPVRTLSSSSASKEIENKKVLFFAPAYSEFHYYESGTIERLSKLITDKDKNFNVSIIKDKACTVDKIASFGDYGLVIMDTHGFPDGFLIGTKLTFPTFPKTEAEMNKGIIAQAGRSVFDLVTNGNLGIGGSMSVDVNKPDWYKKLSANNNLVFELYATSKYVNSMPQWKETVLFGNMCYSGWELLHEPQMFSQPYIKTAFTNRDLISYYGYAFDNNSSTFVEDGFSKSMEDSLVKSFVTDGDSTGRAHLQKSNGKAFNDPYIFNQSRRFLWFKHYLHDNYAYRFCGQNLVDDRDGNVYKTICIGTKQWMAENLRYEVPGGGTYCYDDNPANCQKYGRLYTWFVLMNDTNGSNKNPSGVRGACPKGWHIPSEVEWDNMVATIGGSKVAGDKLKSTTGWLGSHAGATDEYGFSALPGGIKDSTGRYLNATRNAVFWTSNASNTNAFFMDEAAFYKSISWDYPYVWDGRARKAAWAFSCRCVKD